MRGTGNIEHLDQLQIVSYVLKLTRCCRKRDCLRHMFHPGLPAGVQGNESSKGMMYILEPGIFA